MMKTFFRKALLVCAVAAAAGFAFAAPSVDLSKIKGSCTLWTWDSTENAVIAQFSKLYPNIKVNLVSVNYDDYMNKVQAAIAAGSELPDILCGEYNFRAQLFRMNILEDLEAAPYKLDRSQIMDYEIPLSSYNGKLVGLEGSITAGGIAYKAPLAKKYLGTDSVADLEKKLATWNDVINAGKDVQAKSGGKVFLFHTWADVQEIFDCAGIEPLTKDNKPTDYLLNAMPTERYNVLKSMIKYNVFDKTISDHYTPGMNNAIAGDNHIMLDSATWTSAFVIRPNDKNGVGRWREMVAPTGPFNMGGTTYGITKASKNKDAAWAYLMWSFATKEGAEANLALRGFFPPYKPAIQAHDYSKDKEDYFSPQNVSEKFYKLMAPAIKVRPAEIYSNQIKAAFKTVELAVLNDKNDSITLDKYKELVRKEIKNNCPDLDM
jgi:ABC-type sugar transport system, periplasmic component